LVFEAVTQGVSRRRALLIASLALGGAAVVFSQAGRSSVGRGENAEVTVIEFDEAGRKLGPAVRKKNSAFRRRLAPPAHESAVLVSPERLDRHAFYRQLLPTRGPRSIPMCLLWKRNIQLVNQV
jgi:hypothetical protein